MAYDFKQGFLKKNDWLLFLPPILLGILGLIAIYSTDLSIGDADFFNFKKQLIAFILGIIIMFVFTIVNFQQLKNAKNILYFAGMVLLFLVLVTGQNLRGTTGWFVLGPLSFQPVEIIKIILVIFLADYFAREGRTLFAFKDIFKSFIATAIFMVLVLKQPDLGSSVILFSIWLVMLLMSRVRKRHVAILFLVFLITVTSGWFFVLQPYQKERIAVFVNPDLDPLGAGYNIKQSIIAIGSGGFFGQGLGSGSQSQLRFLPEAHTDFIFALIAEEMGFFMVLIVLGLYSVFFWRILVLAKSSTNDFVSFVCIGFLIMFLAEMIINVGMNLGLMPVTGLALPFISLGGSSLVSKFVAVGILQSIKVRS